MFFEKSISSCVANGTIKMHSDKNEWIHQIAKSDCQVTRDKKTKGIERVYLMPTYTDRGLVSVDCNWNKYSSNVAGPERFVYITVGNDKFIQVGDGYFSLFTQGLIHRCTAHEALGDGISAVEIELVATELK